MSAIRGVWKSWQGWMVMPLFHPSFLLRNPSRVAGAPMALTLGDLLKVQNRLMEFKKANAMPMLELEIGGES